MASVLKRGGFWYAKWTDATGKRCRERIEASSKAQAKALADELEVEARRHRNLARRARNGLPPRPDDLTGTFADLCTWWLDHRCPEASRSGERQRLGKYVVSKPVGAVPLAALGSPHLDELLHNAESAGASAASVNKLRSVLHTVFSKAKKAGRWVGENPVASTERRKVARRRSTPAPGGGSGRVAFALRRSTLDRHASRRAVRVAQERRRFGVRDDHRPTLTRARHYQGWARRPDPDRGAAAAHPQAPGRARARLARLSRG